jgi:hypothetical protein
LSVSSTLAEEGLGSLLELQEASKNSTAIIESEAIKSLVATGLPKGNMILRFVFISKIFVWFLAQNNSINSKKAEFIC